MKRKLSAILIALSAAFGVAGFAACDVSDIQAGIIPEDFDNYEWVLDTSEFEAVVGYKSNISYGDIKLIYQLSMNGEVFHGTTISVKEDMVVSGGETDSVGEHEIVIAYEDDRFVIPYTVKYQVDFLSDGVVFDTQYALEPEEIVLPEAPAKSGYTFGYWKTELPEELTDNLSIEAYYYNAMLEVPVLETIDTVYEPFATLSDIKLSSNENGGWEFVDDLATLVGDAGTHEFDVRFIPATDELPVKEEKVTLNVARKQVVFSDSDVTTSFVYDGNGYIPTYTLPEDLAEEMLAQDVQVEVLAKEVTEAGEGYTFTLLVDHKNYYGVYSGTFEITKPDVTITVHSDSIKYGETVPAIEYTVEGFENETLLGLSVKQPSVNGIGEYLLSVTVSNKNVNAIVVNGTLTVEKGDLTVGDPTLSSETVVEYLDPLSSVTLTGDYRGVWSWKAPNARIEDVGSYVATAVFTPNNNNYNSIERQITITDVEKRTLEITVTASEYTYANTEYTIEYAIEDGIAVQVDGNVSATNAGNYEAKLSINDEYYRGTKEVTLVINKATPATDFTAAYTVTWNALLKLQDLKLSEGYTWDAPETSLLDCVGTNEYAATYTPDDTANYNTVPGKFTVTVEKAEGVLSGVKESYAFTYEKDTTYVLSGVSSTPADGTIEYVLENGEKVEGFKNAGTYKVKVTLLESKYYTSATVETEVEVKKAVNGDVVDRARTATYGDKLNALALPTSEFGTWSWQGASETTTVGDAGTRTYVAVFTPDDPDNYECRTVEVTVTVNKQTVYEPTVQAEFVYTGSEIKALEVADGALYTAEGDLVATVAGEYEIALTLEDPANYKWSGSSAATIEFAYKITRAPNAITSLSITGWTFGEEANSPSIEANFGAATVTYYYAPVNTDDYTTTVPTNAGSYTLKAVIDGTANYAGAERTVTAALTIAQAMPSADVVEKDYNEIWRSGLTLADVVPTGSDKANGARYEWVVENAAANETVLTATAYTSFKIKYTPSDKNYGEITVEGITVTIGKADASIGVSATFNGESTTSYVQTYNGSAFTLTATALHSESALVYTLNDVNVENISLTNAGTYEVTITLPESEHYKEAAWSQTITIEQARVTYATPHWEPKVGDTIGELDLPTIDENIAYEWIWQDKDGNELELAQEVGKADETVEYQLYFESKDSNYESFAIPVKLTVGKTIVTPTLGTSTFTYNGEAFTVNVSGLPEGWIGGADYTLEYVTDFTNAGKHTVALTMSEATFAAYRWNDSTTATTTREVTINKTENTVASVTIAGWTYDGTERVPVVETKFGGEVSYQYYNVNTPSTIESGIPVNAGTYVLIATSEGTDNYTSASLESAQFTIEKATPDVSLAQNSASIGWRSGLTLANSGITPNGNGDGTYAWADGSMALDTLTIGKAYTVKVVYTPAAEDRTNYKTIELDFEVTVVKTLVTLQGLKDAYTHTYNGEKFEVTDVYANVDVELAFEYSATPIDAGEYTLTITLSDTDHYTFASDATSVTRTIVIERANNVISSLQIGNWEYGSEASEHVLTATFSDAEYVTYYYSLADENNFTATQPKTMGTYDVKVVIAESTNYKSVEKTFTEVFRITKSTVRASITEQTSTEYTGDLITATVSLSKANIEFTVSCDNENVTVDGKTVSAVNAGTYTLTITLSEEALESCEWADDVTGESATATLSFTIEPIENGLNGYSLEELLPECDYNSGAKTFTITYNGNAQKIDETENWVKVGALGVAYYKLVGENRDEVALGEGEYPTDAGDYKIYLSAEGDGANYAAWNEEIILTINKIATVISTKPTYNAQLEKDARAAQASGYNYTVAPVVTVVDTATVVEGNFKYGEIEFNRGGGENSTYTLSFVPSNANYEAPEGVAVTINLIDVAYYNGSSRVYYGSIEEALNTVTAGEVWVVPKATGATTNHQVVIESDVEVKAGVTLILPYGTKGAEGKNTEGYAYTDKDCETEATDSKTQLSVKVASGVTVTVNGILEVAGQLSGGGVWCTYSGQTYGYHAKIVLEEGATIESNGTIKLTGFIEGKDGRVVINDGSTLWMPFVYLDAYGGTYLARLSSNSNGASPFNRYQFRNIRSATLRMNYGSTLNVYANMYNGSADSSENYNRHSEAEFIGSNGVIQLLNEYSYLESVFYSWDTTGNNSAQCEHEVRIYGHAQTGSLKLTIDSYALNSENFDFPIPSYYNISLHKAKDNTDKDNGIFTMGQIFKLLPGAKFTVEKDATLNLETLIVYTEIDRELESESYSYYETSLYNVPAVFTVNGTLIANKFGGIIYTNEKGAKVQVTSSVSVTVKEVSDYDYGDLGGLTAKVTYADVAKTLALPKAGNMGGVYSATGTYYSDGKGWYTTNYTIGYDFNGGESVGNDTISVTNGLNGYTLRSEDLVALTRTHYTFSHWCLTDNCTDPDCSGVSVGDILYGDTTLYAAWTANEYTMQFINVLPDGTQTSTGIANITFTVESTIALPDTPDAPDASYNFRGWFKADGTQIVSIVGADYADAALANGNLTTIYAHWTEDVVYEVIFQTNNTDCKENPTQAIDSLTLPDLTGKNNDVTYAKYFAGWYVDSALTIPYENWDQLKACAATGGVETQRTLYAKWANKITITVTSANHDDNSDGEQSAVYTITFSETNSGGYYTSETLTKKGGTWYIIPGHYVYLNATECSQITGNIPNGSYTKVTESKSIGVDYDTTAASGGSSSCFTAGTLITLADGSQKKAEDLTTDDVLLVFNHETGEYEAAGIIFIENDGWKEYNVINLTFSDGTTTKLIYEHGYFDLTLNKYVYITEDNYSEFVGHDFAMMAGASYKAVTLTNAYVAKEYIGCYSLVTVYHLNYFVDGLFSMPGGIEGLFNMFEYGEGLKYDEAQMQADIETYGLYTYEDFAEYLPYEVYAAFPAEYFKVSVGKGMITFEEILGYIETYLIRNGII